jgi:ribonuclease HIII
MPKEQLSTKLKPDEIERLKKLLEDMNCISSGLSDHEIFRAKVRDSQIIVYKSGVVVYHQDVMPIISSSLLEDEAVEVGSDEAGKGEIEGPIVVAAVVLDGNARRELRTMGLMESKSIPKKRLFIMRNLIKSKCISLDLEVIEPEEFLSSWKRGNLNDLLVEWHKKAIIKVTKEVRVDRIIIDAFDRTKILSAVEPIAKEIGASLVVEERADENYPTVAAASILARATRDDLIKEGHIERKWRL